MNNTIIYICYFLSFIVGSLFTLALIFKRTHGVLVIDDTGEKTNWSFVVEAPMSEFERSKLVIFKVKKKS